LGGDTSFCAGGSTILGTDNSGDTYLWSTGDTTQTITVSAAGTYSVIVTDTILNETAYDTVSVTLLPLPVAAFTVNSGSNPTFSFTDGSSDATAWSWNFGDGSPVSTSQNPSHTYAPGTYTVTLIATNACGSDTITDTITALVGVENGLLGQVNVFPNPSQGQFVVELTGNDAVAMDVAVFDALGRCVHTQTGALRQAVVLNATEGMYLVRVSTAEGQVVRRVVVR
jgi:PKD repeat protein